MSRNFSKLEFEYDPNSQEIRVRKTFYFYLYQTVLYKYTRIHLTCLTNQFNQTPHSTVQLYTVNNNCTTIYKIFLAYSHNYINKVKR